jgi:RNA polymerase sigma-70 factor (ECF subfamily)
MTGEFAAAWEGCLAVDAEVLQLRRGDLDALTALMARYQNRLYRYLLRIVRERAEAEDLFQQTWLRVAQKIQSFDPSRNFDAWLFTLARNLALDHLRRVRPESLDEPLSENFPVDTRGNQLPSKERTPLDRAIEEQRASRLIAAMNEIPVSFREVLTLRFEEEMKLEEIAEIQGVPLSTVKSRLHRSMDRIRLLLETRFPGEEWL